MISADTYKPLKFFRVHTDEINTGFAPFTVGELHYFAYYFGRKLILISQGYKSIPGRDNGIESVRTNMRIKARYKYRQDADSGKYYFDLIAGNYQGVARSAWFGSEAVARAMSNILIDETGPQPQEMQTYHPEAFFRARISGVANGFDEFKADDGYYFTYNQNNEIVLISTAKPTQHARDEAVDQVRAHMKREEWYEYRTIDTYQHDFRIVDGDEIELARSVVYGSEEAADEASLRLQERPTKITIQPEPAAAAHVPVNKDHIISQANLARESEPETFLFQRIMEGLFKWMMIALFTGFIVWSLVESFTGGQNVSTVASQTGARPGQEIIIAAPEIVCWDESRVANLSQCPPEAFTLSPTITPDNKTAYICGDGSVAEDPDDCPGNN